jgi:heptosyltransferase I
MKKILIVKTSSLGDIIHAFPIINYLKQKFPHVQVDWVIEKSFAELIQAHPFIHRVLMIDTKSWRKSFFNKDNWRKINEFRHKLREVEYDVVFDLQSNVKSGIVTGFSKSFCKVGYGWSTSSEKPNGLFTNVKINPPKGLNIRLELLHIVQTYFSDKEAFVDSGQNLNISSEEKEKIETLLAKPLLRNTSLVMICPGSQWENKQLSMKTMLALLQGLLQANSCKFLLVWGSSQEEAKGREIHNAFPNDSFLMERLTLPVLQNLMSRMDLVVAMDSLPLHLAGTTMTPTFSLFGASSAHKYMPIGSHHHFFQGECPYGRTFEKRCPILRTCATGSCIKDMNIEIVKENLIAVLKKYNKKSHS